MRKALTIAVAVAASACGSNVVCSMKVAVNGGPQETVECFAAGAQTPSGSAVSLAMTGTLPDIQVAEFAISLSSAPSARTYGSADVSDSGGQVQTTASAHYVQSKTGAVGSFSVALTDVSPVSANGQTAYFIHGTATVTLTGQSGAPGTATITATF